MSKKYLLAILASAFYVLLLTGVHASEKKESTGDKPSTTAKKDLQKKQLVTTGFLQELTEKRTHIGKNRTGEEVYDYRCKGCHEKNTQGAPMPDDKFEWSLRLKEKGLPLLIEHSMEGFNNYLMPPKGGCRDCNQQEVYAAVFYMLERSRTELSNDDKVLKKSLVKP